MKTIACRGEHCHVAVAAKNAIKSSGYAGPTVESMGGHLAILTGAAEDSLFRSSAGPIPGNDRMGLTDSQAVIMSR